MRTLIIAISCAALVAVAVTIAIWQGWTTRLFGGGSGVPRHAFLIVVDTLRPDRVSAYGYEKHETAGIDELARLGTRFSRAQSAASWTSPGVAALLTSRYPTELGLIERKAPEDKVFQWRDRRQQTSFGFRSTARPVAEWLRSTGFRTAAFVDQPALNSHSSYRRGFDDWYMPDAKGRIVRYEPGAAFLKQPWPSLDDSDPIDRGLVGAFSTWLKENKRARNLFAWLHLLTPHLPYNPIPRFAPAPPPAGADPEPSDLYDAEIRAVDEMIGQVLRAIDEAVGLDRSIVVFTSDHGEGFGEHGMNEHGHTLHTEVLNVPLIIAGPGVPADTEVDTIVSTIDVAPTILDYVGLDAGWERAMRGDSLRPLIEGDRQPRVVYAEGMLYGSTERAIVVDGKKLMYDEQETRRKLFDMDRDPDEVVDLADRLPELRNALRMRLDRFYGQLVSGDGGGTGASSQEPSPDEERALDALRTLGYID